MATSEAPNRTAGTQTLARGLRALELIANSPGGLMIQDVADALGVHRSIAARLVATIADFHLVNRGPDGRYRAAGGLTALARQVYTGMREVSKPVMQDLANRLGSSIALFIEEGDDAVAVTVTEPVGASVRLAYREGARHPVDRGAAGYALLAALPARPGEDPRVTEARSTGYVVSFGEIVTDYWGLAVPLMHSDPASCLTLISASKDVVDTSADAMIAAAAAVSTLLN